MLCYRNVMCSRSHCQTMAFAPLPMLTSLPTNSNITCCCQSCSAWRFKISNSKDQNFSNTKLRSGLFADLFGPHLCSSSQRSVILDLLLQSSLSKLLHMWHSWSFLQPKLLVNANSSSFIICYCYFYHVSTCIVASVSWILSWRLKPWIHLTPAAIDITLCINLYHPTRSHADLCVFAW